MDKLTNGDRLTSAFSQVAVLEMVLTGAHSICTTGCCFIGKSSSCLQAAVQGTQFYENYTGIVLPLKKLDFVAIPGRKGAVENWGLIQFDERRMLFNQVNSHFFRVFRICLGEQCA